MHPRWCPQVCWLPMYCSKRLVRAVCLAWLVALLVACGGGGGGANTAPATPTTNPGGSPAQDNVLGVTVDAGPNGNAVNALYATVTVCQPGSTSNCQTIDHILVDSGSTGLRLVSGVLDSGLNLPRSTTAGGTPLLNCAQFLDSSYAWGPVATADVLLGGRRANAIPIQLIADPTASASAATCSSGEAITDVASLGAKGILGMGILREDCGSDCSTVAANGFYYTCADAPCAVATPSTARTDQQLQNPIPRFATDTNGLVIDLPTPTTQAATSLSGSITFGIGTQTNNQFTQGTVLNISGGHITTVFAGRSLGTSFLDTGSNGLFFDSQSLPRCRTTATGFYCPTALTPLNATLSGSKGTSVAVSFAVDNAVNLFLNSTDAALPTLAGPVGDADTFDWGLPFFYGRRIFIGIEQQNSPLGTGPFYAF